jgi:hypothetical protein
MKRFVREFLLRARQLPQRFNHTYQYTGIWLQDHLSPIGAFTLIITNDPDHGKTDDYVRIFSDLHRLGIKITTAVFCTMDDDGSDLARHCYRGETHTLADPAYRDLMLALHEQGHEIAFHGYSQVSNRREKFIEGLEIFKDTFGHYPFTYVEHGGNPKTHSSGMCKRETLAMEGMDPESNYYIWDIVKEKISCVWAWHDLLDDDYAVKQLGELFYQKDNIWFFRRSRLFYLDCMLKSLTRHGGIFIGYTHFGFTGYSKEPQYRLENWTGPHLKTAIGCLEQILKRHKIANLTIQELVQSKFFDMRGDKL